MKQVRKKEASINRFLSNIAGKRARSMCLNPFPSLATLFYQEGPLLRVEKLHDLGFSASLGLRFFKSGMC